MTLTIIIAVCFFILIAYLFDITSSRTKIPSVILLLLLGWAIKQLTDFFKFRHIPDFSLILPILGTIGLILIVLEGSLSIKMNRAKSALIVKSFFGALLPMFALAFSLVCLIMYFGGYSFKISLINAIPLCVISSAFAIPSTINLSSANREFIIYESSLSDVIGVVFFNFIVLNNNFNFYSFGYLGLQCLIILFVSFISIVGLSFLLSKIEHHIKFIPIILIVILIYSIAEFYNLPALIFILLFGLFLGNIDVLKKFKRMEKFHSKELDTEINKFRELTNESAFLVRTFFFLIFGYLIETSMVLNMADLIWAICIVAFIFVFRTIQLKISKLPLMPLLFIAPRGLVTILLFLSIGSTQRILFISRPLIVQVVVLTSLLMMAGLMISTKRESIQSQ
ncbi:MAG: cation:proton antiporter [Candidatus Omnitrophica bacterium]|nr:cation:proton antiporter [Candidatus Omnitrophota bacterium]